MWPVTFLFGKQNQRLILRKSDTTELSVNHKLHNSRKNVAFISQIQPTEQLRL